jgi:hypothetical protein
MRGADVRSRFSQNTSYKERRDFWAQARAKAGFITAANRVYDGACSRERIEIEG